MTETSSETVVETFEHARVLRDGGTAYYVPREGSDVGSRPSNEGTRSRHPALVSFTREAGSKRDPSRRAAYWALLQDRVGDEDEAHPLAYDTRLVDAESPGEIQIPWGVALTANKAVYAAYLAAHGKPNAFLADALGVSTSTVSQYLSDFKSGRR